MKAGNKLILAFVTLIIGVVLIGTIATQGNAVTEKTNVAGESTSFTPLVNTTINETETLSLTNAPTGWKVDDCPITNLVLSNGSDALTVTTDYVFTAASGTFTLKDTAAVRALNDTNATISSYTYCADDYLNLSWGRTMIDLVGGFFAIGLLLVSVGLFYSVAKEQGII